MLVYLMVISMAQNEKWNVGGFDPWGHRVWHAARGYKAMLIVSPNEGWSQFNNLSGCRFQPIWKVSVLRGTFAQKQDTDHFESECMADRLGIPKCQTWNKITHSRLYMPILSNILNPLLA